MDDRKQQIDAFFDRYEARFNEGIRTGEIDVDDTMASFADCFVEASPHGVVCGRNDEGFRAAIPRGYAFYKSVGITSMNILSKDIVLLDGLHSMARIAWRSVFTKKDGSGGGSKFEVIYFLQVKEDRPMIFAYITGDEQKALEDYGLI